MSGPSKAEKQCFLLRHSGGARGRMATVTFTKKLIEMEYQVGAIKLGSISTEGRNKIERTGSEGRMLNRGKYDAKNSGF